MKCVHLLPAVACLVLFASWSGVAHACGAGAAGAGGLEILVVLLAVFGIGVSATVALGRGSASLRRMARRSPTRTLKIASIWATIGFGITAMSVAAMLVFVFEYFRM